MEELEQQFLNPESDSQVDEDRIRALIQDGIKGYRAPLQTGAGNQIFRSSNRGIQLGNSTFDLAPFRVDMDGNLFASSVTIAGILLATSATFGGDGSDGPMVITSGVTNVDLLGQAFVTKNYTELSVTGTASITFSNPHPNGSYITLKSQGNVTLTSSAAPMIDASGMGAAAGAASAGGGGNNGNDGTDFDSENLDTGVHLGTKGFYGGAGGTAGVGGAAIASTLKGLLIVGSNQLYHRSIWVKPGAGGGSGGDGSGATAGGGGDSVTIPPSGAGGRGGGALIIECGGAWNFTTALGISVAGKAGGTPSNTTGSGNFRGSGSGGGGGGGGGHFLGLYKTLTANSGTVNYSGGDGGNGGNAAQGGAVAGTYFGGGGAGAGAQSGAGGNGGIGITSANGSNGTGTNPGTGGTGGTDTANCFGGGAGGGGGTGASVIAQNFYFA